MDYRKTTSAPGLDRVSHHFNVAQGLLLLLGTLLAGLFLTGFVAAGINTIFPAGERTAILLSSAAQAILAFIIPAIATWRIMRPHPLISMNADRGYTWQALLGIIIIYAVSVPAIDQIVFWNEHITLPAAMAGVEETLRKMEEMNAAVGETLMDTDTIGGLISGIAVVGILTGIAEEFFFRGGMQRIMTQNGVNHHVAIWVTAFVFSAIHFQFFGFFPRLLMGAWFGYLMWWTGSVWASATAHALNNSMVVLITWLTMQGILPESMREMGLATAGMPWLALTSAVVTALLIARGGFFRPASKHYIHS